MTNYSFPLCNVETSLLASRRINTCCLSSFTVSCMYLHFFVFSICKWPSYFMYSQSQTLQARSQLNLVIDSNLLMIWRMLTVRDLFSGLPNVPALFKALLSSCSISFLGVKGAQGGKISNVWARKVVPTGRRGKTPFALLARALVYLQQDTLSL